MGKVRAGADGVKRFPASKRVQQEAVVPAGVAPSQSTLTLSHFFKPDKAAAAQTTSKKAAPDSTAIAPEKGPNLAGTVAGKGPDSMEIAAEKGLNSMETTIAGKGPNSMEIMAEKEPDSMDIKAERGLDSAEITAQKEPDSMEIMANKKTPDSAEITPKKELTGSNSHPESGNEEKTPSGPSEGSGKSSTLERSLRSRTPKATPEPPTVALEAEEKKPKSVRRKRESSGNSNQDVWTRFRQRTKYLLGKIRQEQNFLDAYCTEGWNRHSSEKIRPEKELQKAENQIRQYKLGIRNLMEELDTLAHEGSIDGSVFDTEGQIFSEDIFCAKCKSHEPFPENDIILCDGACNRGFHQFCLEPPLKTEDIPPGDEGWLCPACSCKFDCLDFVNAHFETNYQVEESSKDFFPEVAMHGQPSSDGIDWPSEESEDEDYNPDVGSLKTGKEVQNLGSASDEDSESGSGSTDGDDDSDSDVSFFDEFAEDQQNNGEDVGKDGFSNEEEPALHSREKRKRKEWDYKKLYDETFKGAGAIPTKIGENSGKGIDWGMGDSDSEDYDPELDDPHTNGSNAERASGMSSSSSSDSNSDSDSTDDDSQVSFFDEFAENKKKTAKAGRNRKTNSQENLKRTGDAMQMSGRAGKRRKVDARKNLDVKVTAAMVGTQIDLPSEDSEDGDYNPVNTNGPSVSSDDGSGSGSGSDSSDDDSEVSFFDEFADKKKSEIKSDGAISGALDAGNCTLEDVENSPLVEGKRCRQEVDYKKLYQEMYGNNLSDKELSEDEAWGPRKKARKGKLDESLRNSNSSQPRAKQEKKIRDVVGEKGDNVIGNPDTSQPKQKTMRLSPQITEKLREVFQKNQLPSKACKEELSGQLDVPYEKVNQWFRNARRAALRSHKGSAVPDSAEIDSSFLTEEQPQGETDNGGKHDDSTKEMETGDANKTEEPEEGRMYHMVIADPN